MKYFKTSHWVFLIALSGLLQGCSLDSYQGPEIKVVFENAKKSFSLSKDFGMFALPASYDGFSCYMANIMGDGISAHPYEGGGPIPYEAIGNGCDWYLGIPSTLSPSYQNTFEISVPIGARRVVQFVGIDSADGCTQGEDMVSGLFDSPATVSSNVSGVYSLGLTKTDIFSAQTVAVQNEFDATTAVNAVGCQIGGGTPSGPASVQGLILWLNGDTLSSSYASGADINVWTDSSGLGNAVSSAGSPLPTYYLVNGHGVARFGSSPATHFRKTNPNGVSSLDGMTLIMVAEFAPSPSAQNYFLFSAGNNVAFSSILSGFGLNTLYSAGSHYYYGTAEALNGTFSNVQDTVAVNGAPTVISIQGANHLGSQHIRLYRNGIITNGSPNLTNAITAVSYFVIGAESTAAGVATSGYRGDIAEVILYNREISDSDREKLECSLGTKYGITIAGHNCP